MWEPRRLTTLWASTARYSDRVYIEGENMPMLGNHLPDYMASHLRKSSCSLFSCVRTSQHAHWIVYSCNYFLSRRDFSLFVFMVAFIQLYYRQKLSMFVSCTLWRRMGVGREAPHWIQVEVVFTPCSLYFNWIGRWMDPGVTLDAVEKRKISFPSRGSNSDF
jgi:hypothetical protein